MTYLEILSFLDALDLNYSSTGAYSNLKNIVIECPFAKWEHHNGIDSKLGNASIRVQEPHLFNCFSCGAGSGTLKTMLYELRRRGHKFKDFNHLLELVGSNKKFSDAYQPKIYDAKFDTSLQDRSTEPSQKIYDYLASRGVRYSTVDKYGIKQARDYMTIPLLTGTQEVVGVAKRLVSEKNFKKPLLPVP